MVSLDFYSGVLRMLINQYGNRPLDVDVMAQISEKLNDIERLYAENKKECA